MSDMGKRLDHGFSKVVVRRELSGVERITAQLECAKEHMM